MSHSITECAEHIHIIIFSAQKANNVILTLELVTYHTGSEELKLAGNIVIFFTWAAPQVTRIGDALSRRVLTIIICLTLKLFI